MSLINIYYCIFGRLRNINIIPYIKYKHWWHSELGSLTHLFWDTFIEKKNNVSID